MDESQKIIKKHILLTGRVQGVGFRRFLKKFSERAGFIGWVRNRGDRAVEAYLEGPRSAWPELETLLVKGPPGSRVEALQDLGAGSTDVHHQGVEIRENV